MISSLLQVLGVGLLALSTAGAVLRLAFTTLIDLAAFTSQYLLAKNGLELFTSMELVSSDPFVGALFREVGWASAP